MTITKASAEGIDGHAESRESPLPRSTGANAHDDCARDDQPALLDAYKEKIANLERALASNRRIGIAVGILMAQTGSTNAQAFEALWEVSQHRNRKLREIAEDVIYTGALLS